MSQRAGHDSGTIAKVSNTKIQDKQNVESISGDRSWFLECSDDVPIGVVHDTQLFLSSKRVLAFLIEVQLIPIQSTSCCIGPNRLRPRGGQFVFDPWWDLRENFSTKKSIPF